MPLFACVTTESNSVLHERELASQPPDLPHKGLKWLPVTVIDPSFDPAAEVKEGPAIAVLASEVTKLWTVRAKTVQELDADKIAKVDGVSRVAFLAAFNHENRIRALEGQPPVTQAQFRNALKGLL
jgi:hypothetical protein